MMKVEDEQIFVGEKIGGGDVFVINKMTPENWTLSKIEQLRITFFVV